jgi:hypothetical protein
LQSSGVHHECHDSWALRHDGLTGCRTRCPACLARSARVTDTSLEILCPALDGNDTLHTLDLTSPGDKGLITHRCMHACCKEGGRVHLCGPAPAAVPSLSTACVPAARVLVQPGPAVYCTGPGCQMGSHALPHV